MCNKPVGVNCKKQRGVGIEKRVFNLSILYSQKRIICWSDKDDQSFVQDVLLSHYLVG
jgi:hypothetical protein